MTAFQVPFTIDTLDGNSSPLQDLTNATSDYTMNIGETVFRSMSNAGVATVPLHIATLPNQLYEVLIVNTARATGPAGFYLWPNNINYGSVFTYREVNGAGGTAAAGALGNTNPFIGVNGGSVFFARGHISTVTAGKYWQFSSQESSASTSYAGLMCIEWQDSTTPWTSLGSFNINYAFTGIVFIKRLF